MVKFQGENGIKIKNLIDCIKAYCGVDENYAKKLLVEAITQKEVIKAIEKEVVKAIEQ